ncbi:MAG: PAS domain S-box protein [Deltaproteobacteria bacterium]|nr:MAG: PAS domain S-box protein [Deltaproteobacteria bacterium]
MDILVVAGLDGFFKKVNPALVNTLDWTAEELLSRPWIEFVHPLDRQATEAARDALVAGEKVARFENRYQGKDGSIHWLSWTSMPMPEQGLIFAVARETTGQKQAEEELQRYRADLEKQVRERTALLTGINLIFREALFCETEEQLGQFCLTVAEKLTGSKFSYLAEVDQAGNLEIIAISNPGWSACEMPVSEALRFLKHIDLRGLRSRVMMSAETLIFNDSASHPDWIDPPKGHPAINSFLGTPLKSAGQVFGMIGLANREGGYHKGNQKDMEALAVAVVEALTRKRAERKLAQLRGHHELILSSASEGIIGLDLQGNMSFVNPAAAQMLGYEAAELISRNAHAVIHHSKSDGSPFPEEECRILETLQSGSRIPFEDDWFWRKDGAGFPVRCSTNPLIHNGWVSGTVLTFRDITAWKEAESALRESEQRFRDITEHAVEWIWEVDSEGRFTYSSPVVEKLLGYTPEEVLGKYFYDFFLPEEREEMKDAAFAVFAAKRPFRDFLNRNLHKNGKTVWLSTSGVPMLDASGNLLGYRGADHDITTRKLAEAEIARLASFPQLNPNPVLEVDFQGDITYANSAAHEVAEKLGLQNLRYFLPADLEEILGSIREGKEDQFWRENRLRERIISVYIYAVPQFRVARLFFVDITGQKQVEEELRLSEERFRHISSTISDISYSCSRTGIPPEDGVLAIDWMVGAAERITGYSVEEIKDRGCWGFLVVEEDLPLYEKNVLGLPVGLPGRCELRFRHKNGEIVWVESFAEVIEKQEDSQRLRLYGGLVDITARKEAEAAIKESLEKLHQTLQKTVKALSSTIEIRDPYTAGHQRRVTQLAQAIARELGLSKDQKDALCIAGTIHDLGKICVPAEILSRPGRLSDSEFSLVKDHPLKGYEILEPIQFPWPVAQIVRQHHERLNGSGYPDGLHNEEILLEARILAVADVVEAIASHRPYRPALGIDAALEEISRNRDILFDREVVDACIKVFKEKAFTF